MYGLAHSSVFIPAIFTTFRLPVCFYRHIETFPFQVDLFLRWEAKMLTLKVYPNIFIFRVIQKSMCKHIRTLSNPLSLHSQLAYPFLSVRTLL